MSANNTNQKRIPNPFKGADAPQQQQQQQQQQALAPPPPPSMAAGGGGGASSSSGAVRQIKKQVKKAKAKTASELKHWFRRCRRKHLKQMTPELQARMKANAVRQNREQMKHRLGRKAKKMAYASASARSNVMSSIATYSPAFLSAGPPQSKKELEQTRAVTHAKLAQLNDLQSARLSESESEDDIDLMDQEGEQEAAAVSETKAKSLLDELRVEPKDDQESADKFKIYEQYLSIVEKSRKECVLFHATCTEQLKEHANLIRKMEKAIKSIDSESNTSINWDALGGRWFVYDMTTQSDRNNTFIGRIFQGLKRDLEMVQDNDMDCCICLENLTTVPSGVRVLHCCHKLCGECYDSWKMACAGGRVICPLCRQEDFQQAIVARPTSLVQRYLHDMHSESEDSESEGEGEPAEAEAAPAAPVALPSATTLPATSR